MNLKKIKTNTPLKASPLSIFENIYVKKIPKAKKKNTPKYLKFKYDSATMEKPEP